MSTAWAQVRALIHERKDKALADRVIALTEAERAEVAERLPEFLNELRDVARRSARSAWSDEPMPVEKPEWAKVVEDAVNRGARFAVARLGAALRIVGAGTIATPAAVTAWLTRRELYSRQLSPRPTQVIRVLATRPAEWQADVARRLCRKINAGDDPIAPVALALLRACGGEPPEHDPLVLAWVTDRPLPGDPLAATLLPRIFEAEGVGRALREVNLTPGTDWYERIRRLLDEGRVTRAELLDGCVSRFLRGGGDIDLRFFARVHRMLDPTPQEAAARVRDYLRLLPTAPGPVAELALAQVRRTGPHDDADVVEAIGALTFRAEAKLVRAGLSWLDQEVRRAPARAGELAPALVTAFAHPSYGVRHRAARIAVKHAAAFAPAAAMIAEAVPQLPPDLGTQVAAMFGGEVAKEPPFVPAPLPAVEEPAPFPPPLIEEGKWDIYGWVESERWLAGFVEHAWNDREGLRKALYPAFNGSYPYLYEKEHWLVPSDWIAALAKEVIAPGTDPNPPQRGPLGSRADRAAVPAEGEETRTPGQALEEMFRQMVDAGLSAVRIAMRDGQSAPSPASDEPGLLEHIGYMGYQMFFGRSEKPDSVEFRRSRLPEPAHVSPPHMFLLRRLSELYAALRNGTLPPVLLATPTVMTGHLDPDVLVDRLEMCAAAGVEPLAADLRQALLRLPRGAHPEAAARAARIESKAAAVAAAWLAGDGMPDPETGLKWGYLEGAFEYLFEEREPRYAEEIRLVPVLRAKPTGHDLIDELLRQPEKWRWEPYGYAMDWWPSILPSHREVIAVNYLPHLFYGWVDPRHLAALACADGPVGDATALILARFLAVRGPETVPVLLRMAARGDLPVEALGRQLALLIRHSRVETRPLIASLTEAARRGAHHQVWEILKSMLPVLLPGQGERPTIAHVETVALAADVATWADAHGEIPAVSAHAARGGRSRFVRECVRLRDQLR